MSEAMVSEMAEAFAEQLPVREGAGLRITEVPRTARALRWDDVRGRTHMGVYPVKRNCWAENVLGLCIWGYGLVLLALLVIGAFTVGHWVHNAWRERVSLETVQVDAVRRTH